MPSPPEFAREPKASRIRVFQAVERITRSGRRPTVEGVRELLGGGSPNSVTAYINQWYQELGGRLAAAETPMPGLPPEAVSLLAELWRVATDPATGAAEASTVSDGLRDAERAALVAETKAADTLNKELRKHRAIAEQSLAEARALLARREAALDEERANVAGLEQALAQTRLELEVALERQRLARVRLVVSRSGGPPAKRRKVAIRAGTKRPARRPRAAKQKRSGAKTARSKQPASKRRRTRPKTSRSR